MRAVLSFRSILRFGVSVINDKEMLSFLYIFQLWILLARICLSFTFDDELLPLIDSARLENNFRRR